MNYMGRFKGLICIYIYISRCVGVRMYYSDNVCPGLQPNSSGWDLSLNSIRKLWNGRNGKSGKLSHSTDGSVCAINVLMLICMYT